MEYLDSISTGIKLIVGLIAILSALGAVVYQNWTTRRDTVENTTALREVKVDLKSNQEAVHEIKTDIHMRESAIRQDTIAGMDKIKSSQDQQIALMHELHTTMLDKVQDLAIKIAETK